MKYFEWISIVVKVVLGVLWTFILFLIWSIGKLFTKIFSLNPADWRYLSYRVWVTDILKIVGIELPVEGEAPENQFVLVSNHLSYLDIPVLASEVNTSFVAKSEISERPIMGYLCDCMGTLYVDRSSLKDTVIIVNEMHQKVREEEGITFFPGGKSSNGEEVKIFYSPLFELAMQQKFACTFCDHFLLDGQIG